MNFQRRNCGSCDDCEHKVSCKECSNYYHRLLFIPTHTRVSCIKCISLLNAKVECNCGKLENRTNLNKQHLKICVHKIKQKKVNDTIDTSDITHDAIDTIDTNDTTIATDTNHKLNRELIVGASFCGETYLLLNN